jgi:hypothetical protein
LDEILEIFYFFKLAQPLTVSRAQLLYTVKEKGGKPDRKPYLWSSLWFKKFIQTSSLRTLKVIPRNIKEIVTFMNSASE